MEFSLIHAGLAAGVGLAALPVILHLFMRQTPKHVVFPALRLVRERQKRSKKRLRVKNWLLLLARMAVLALMALALARPRLYSQVPLGDESVPTALGLVFDTSLSMGYKEKDKTRLDEAKERARAILDEIPDSSLVFVVDSHDPLKPPAFSPAAARKRIDELTIHPVSRPLNSVMGQIYPEIAECDRPRHEVYVLTDLARSSWNPDQRAEGLDRVEKASATPGGKITTFVVRLGSEERTDVAIDEAESASAVATQGEPLDIKGVITAQGEKPANRLVEFYIDGVKKGDAPITVSPGQSVEVNFKTPPHLQEGEVHRGELRLSGSPDPLEFNDRRHFTFKVRPALRVLLIADQAIDADFVAFALDPESGSGTPKTFQLDRVLPRDLVAKHRDTLRNYAAVFLLNVEALDDDAWGMLNGYVHEGGGLVVGVGDRCRAENYNGPIAGQVIPAELDQVRSPKADTTFGKIADVTHPLFQRYVKEFEPQFGVIPVYRYWGLKLHDGAGARTLLTFSDGAPALVERSFKGLKTGRSLLWSTPLSRRYRPTERGAWNEFPLPSFWVFVATMNITVPYLAGTATERLNFEAGENVLLTLGPGARFQSFQVTGPDEKTTESITPSTSRDELEIIQPQVLGQWTVMAKDAENRQTRLGFSLNPPRTESHYTALKIEELDAIFGKDGYALAGDSKALKELTNVSRVGIELFPWLMMLILIIVTLENFLANTFYRESARPDPVGATG